MSGVGDDVNPCSRTAPCKTFAGAISKTAAGGEINVLDPGGYGAVTITKSMTIDGGGQFASILVSGTNGITVNAGATDTVVLRNLSINGIGSGISGVNFVAGKSLVVEHCAITGFTFRGISVATSTVNSRTMISDTIIVGGTNNGIIVNPPSGITAHVVLDNVRVAHHTGTAVGSTAGGMVTIRNSDLTQSGAAAVVSSGANFSLHDTMISGSHIGIQLLSSGTASLDNVTVTHNGTGLDTAGGTLLSYGNNQIVGNGANNGPVSGLISRQ